MASRVEFGAVIEYLGEDGRTCGPLSLKDEDELMALSPGDRKAASTLLRRGAAGFLVFSAAVYDEERKVFLQDSIKLERIVIVAGSKIVGDFATENTAPNQSTEPGSPERAGSS